MDAPFTEKRPWGEFRQFTAGSKPVGEAVTVKIIFVKKGQALSLQKHHGREEFWRILRGRPEITIAPAAGSVSLLGSIRQAKEGDEFTVPAGYIHRIAASHEDVEILEISRGQFDEADIERLEDKYGRA